MKTMFLVAIAGLAIAAPSSKAAAQHAAEQHDAHHAQMMKGLSDAQFVPMMIRHHQHGIEMARVVEQRGSSAEVRELATKIRQSQEKDMAELEAHAAHHAGKAADDPHGQMMDKQSQTMMKRLQSLAESELDDAFVQEMAKHHEMAIGMIDGAKLQDPALKQLAQRMAAQQKQDLAELKKLMKARD
jgi:uncharacterized protein (DUF305 family)